MFIFFKQIIKRSTREITDIKLLGKGFTVNICFATKATALKGIIWIASNITGGVRTASGSEKG